MSRADYGRAFQIRSRDVRSYDRTKKYKRNPMGVTTLAQVNGRGAYSARKAAKGKSKAQRINAARKLLNKNAGGKTVQKRGRRASFVSNATPAAKRRGKRLGAYSAARKRGMTANAAARSALRKVPWTAAERKSGSTFRGMRANRSRGGRATPTGRPKKTTKRTHRSNKRRYRRNGTEGPISAAWSAVESEHEAKAAKKAARKKGKTVAKKTPKRKKSQYKRVKTTKRVRYKFGNYKRARILNPRTGKVEYSYMYRTKGGKLRRIPTSAVVGKKVKGTKELPLKVRKGRARAAKRIIRSGGAFVANVKRSRARMRSTEKARLVHKGYSKAKAARAALRKFPFTEAEKRAGKKMLKSGKIKVVKSKAKRKTTKRKSTAKRRKTTAKRKTTKRKVAKRRTTKRATAKRRSTRKTTRRAAPKRRSSGKRVSAKRRLASKKGWATRRRRYGKKGHRKNAAMFQSLLGTAALVGVGFLLHRGLTAGVCMLLTGDKNGGADASPEDTEANNNGVTGLGRYRRRSFGQSNGNGNGNGNGGNMTKPLIGAGVALVGSFGAVYVGGELGPALAAGMIASVIGQAVVAIAKEAGAPEIAKALGGYSNSMAYSLRGRGVGRIGRRRAMRGMGAVKSIMPRYSPVGAFQQAAAGMGEYFTPNSLGEYFAPNNLQGVGAYESAGQLAMQASAGMGQASIDDGIRPDTNLDRVLDLAEAAAGLRGVGQAQFAQAAAGMPGGIGEYITAERQNGGYVEQRVPTSSQWVPNGPLWAGTLGVTADRQTSDIPAGVLAGPGGNGILSGG